MPGKRRRQQEEIATFSTERKETPTRQKKRQRRAKRRIQRKRYCTRSFTKENQFEINKLQENMEKVEEKRHEQRKKSPIKAKNQNGDVGPKKEKNNEEHKEKIEFQKKKDQQGKTSLQEVNEQNEAQEQSESHTEGVNREKEDESHFQREDSAPLPPSSYTLTYDGDKHPKQQNQRYHRNYHHNRYYHQYNHHNHQYNHSYHQYQRHNSYPQRGFHTHFDGQATLHAAPDAGNLPSALDQITLTEGEHFLSRREKPRNNRWSRNNRSQKKKVSIPENWSDVPKIADSAVTQFVILRVPLDAQYSHLMDKSEHWTPTMFIEEQKSRGYKVGMVIDLTNTFKYYNGATEFQGSSIEYVKQRIEGFNHPPNERDVTRFLQTVDTFLEKSPEGHVAVHCTHGLNRTGYLIVNYLVRRKGFTVKQALDAFATARPPGLIKHMYVEELYRLLGKDEEVELPTLPDWAQAKYAKKERKKNKNKTHTDTQLDCQ